MAFNWLWRKSTRILLGTGQHPPVLRHGCGWRVKAILLCASRRVLATVVKFGTWWMNNGFIITMVHVDEI